MGDSSCLIHGFSYASAVPNEAKQGTPMHALGESISFGRFMTEPLSWERWSSFSSSHKKYAEEAERYAQPGSVAEKKAFFEAHYRRIAAQRAAALLEQENEAKRVAEESDENVAVADDNACCEQVDDFKAPADLDFNNEDAKIQNLKDDLDKSNSHISVAPLDGRGENDCVENQEEDSTKLSPLCDLQAKQIPLNELESTDNVDGAKEMKKPLLKHIQEEITRVHSKKRTAFSTSIQGRQSKLLSTPVKPVTPNPYKENNPSEISRKSARSSAKSLWSLKEPDKDVYSITKKNNGSCGKRLVVTQAPSKESKVHATPLRTAKVGVSEAIFTAPVATPQLESKRNGRTPDRFSASGSKPAGSKWHILSAAKSSAKSLWSMKELDFDRVSVKKNNEMCRRSHAYTQTPSKESRAHATPMKTGVSVNKNNEMCRRSHAYTQTPSKESRAHATPMKTGKVGASKAVFTSPAATPQIKNTRIVTPGEFSASGNKSCGPKWHIMSAVSKSYTACRNRLQNTVLSTPFVLRTEERAAMRKQKLEEKFSACKTPNKVQTPKSLKEKAGNEFQKMSRSLCFKNGNLPNFYKETQTSKLKKDITRNGGIASVPPVERTREAQKPRSFIKDPLIRKDA